jgi:NADH-quinone oxidoreductase subunit L
VTARDILDLVWLVPAFPLLGAVVLVFVGRRIGEPKAGWLATGLIGLSFAWSVVTFFALRSLAPDGRSHVRTLFTWIPAGGLQVKLGFLVDPLSVTFILFVSGVGALIHLYSIGYMRGDPRFSRFFAYMNLFVAAMLILVLGSSFLVTFLGWEGVGLCSYLLVSFWFERNSAAVAGKKAFVTTRVGDFGFMLAMFLIFATLGSLDYSAMNVGAGTLANGTVTAIALLLFLGAVGKSAQIPLHIWLPDAMEGPTPVSALIHAATMVTAGVFLVARAHPFFVASSSAPEVVAWVGAITALLAGTVALVQPDIKRVLAYSTVSQLGYMFLALGTGAYAAGIALVVTHAFFKATLFLGAGSVIHADADNQDIRTMGGLRKYLPYTAGAFIVAWLSIAGMPPFSGFWAKDDVLAKAFFAHDYGVWIIGTVAALLTGFYMTREVYLVFFGNERFRTVSAVTGAADDWHRSPTVDVSEPPRPARLDRDPHEARPTMLVPVLVLGALSAVAGVLALPFRSVEFLGEWLDPVFTGVPAHEPTSFVSGFVLSTLAVAFGLAGILVARALYKRGLADPARDPVDARLGPLSRVFGQAYYFEALVADAVRGPLRRVADWLTGVVDLKVIDGAVNGVGSLVRRAGGGLRRLQTGLVRQYAIGIVVGGALLLLYMLTRAAP